MYEIERIIVEVASVVACFVLLKFLVKPYQFTGESRYLFLPLGFGFLGVSYAVSALAFTRLFDFSEIAWQQLLLRAFAFAFLAITYYFSKQTARSSKLLWNITLTFLICILVILLLLSFTAPQFTQQNYQFASVCVRVFNMSCLLYIIIHTLRSHVEKPDPTTIMIPFGYLLLGIGQYSLLIWAVDTSILAFFAGLASRLAALAVFLFVAYKTFYGSWKRGNK